MNEPGNSNSDKSESSRTAADGKQSQAIHDQQLKESLHGINNPSSQQSSVEASRNKEAAVRLQHEGPNDKSAESAQQHQRVASDPVEDNTPVLQFSISRCTFNRTRREFSIKDLNAAMQNNRDVYSIKLNRMFELAKHLGTSNALYIPDIILSAPSEFRRETFNITPPAELGLRLGSHKLVACQAIFIALRPQFMQPIYEKIVYTGQAKGKQFLGLARVESSPKVPEQMGDTLQIVDPVNGISTTRVPTSTSFASSAESTEPFLITGPRHVGKSHIMFHLAARLACDPGVVVVHIGNCRELLLDDSERDRFKYVKFVEHLVGAFGNYPFISAIADRWYVNTGMGTDALKMRDATNEFLSSLTQQCKSEDITLVFFLEHCEEFMYEAPFQVITSIGQLRHDYGAIVVMSSSNPVKLHFGEAMRWYQCIVSGPLNLVDAKNMCINSAKRLRMTSNELVTLLKSVEYHPLDAAGIVQAFENHFADGLKTTQDKKAHRQAAIEYAIADQRQVRRNRITEMHLWFLQQAMVSAAKRSDPKNIRRVGMTQSVIDTNSPELLADKREIMRCIFILFHAVELKPGAIRDIQFMLPENNANSSHEDSRDRAATVIPSYAAQCHPPVATDIIYNMYFRGTAKEQFGWLFDSNRYNVEARIRLRYFDMLFLEKGRLSGTVFSPLSTNSWDKNMSFVFVNCAFDAAGLKDVETRVCTKFSEALDVIQQYIESTKDLGPEYLPRVGQTRLENTIVFYFPRLGLEEEWMKQARPARHFQGSFMAAVTRIDMFSEHNREHLCGHTGCRFKITWISSDPIYVDKSKGEAAQRAQPARVKLAEDLVPEPVEDIPRDTVDFDGEFGSEHSWTAKVVQLFPEIRERTLDIGANSSLIDNVSLLALAAEQRFLNLLPANKRPLEKLVDLGKYSESINDIGIISTSEGCFSPEVKLRI